MRTPSQSAPGDLGAGLPNYTKQEVADYLRAGFWTWFGEKPHNFNLGSDGLGANNGVIYYNVSGWEKDTDGLTAAGADLARLAVQLYASVLDVVFVETTSAGDEVDLFFSDNLTGGSAGYDWLAGSAGTLVDRAWVNVEETWLTRYGEGIGSYTLQTYIHEIGHALGLGHAGGYDGAAVYVESTDDPNYSNNSNLYLNDSWQMSIMSYFDQRENMTLDASFARLLTPMMADWIALVDIETYSISAFLGDTIYGFGTNIAAEQSMIWNRLSESANTNAFNIIDSGGTDTVDFSGYDDDQTIRLTGGAVSDVGGLIGNMTISPGTIIENAVGGAGNDWIEGNAADNVIYGGAGMDRLPGRMGGDELYLAAGGGTAGGGSDDDRLSAEGGNDAGTLLGGSGNDWLLVSSSAGEGDVFLVGPGEDTPVFDAPGLVAVDLRQDQMLALSMDGCSAPVKVFGIERLSASDGDDTIYGDAGWNRLDGCGGKDVIFAGAGNDLLLGGRGSDRLFGGGGDDLLVGGKGRDRLVGGAGSDLMRGGNGDDTYVVNDTGDRVIEYAGKGVDTVISWIDFDLRLGSGQVENLSLSGRLATFGCGNGKDNVITGTDVRNVLNGRAGDDELSGGAGDDRLLGGIGHDVFRFAFGDGRDTIVDFDPAADTIHLDSGAAGYDDLTIWQSGSNAFIEYGAGDRIRVLDVDVADLTEDLFSF